MDKREFLCSRHGDEDHVSNFFYHQYNPNNIVFAIKILNWEICWGFHPHLNILISSSRSGSTTRQHHVQQYPITISAMIMKWNIKWFIYLNYCFVFICYTRMIIMRWVCTFYCGHVGDYILWFHYVFICGDGQFMG